MGTLLEAGEDGRVDPASGKVCTFQTLATDYRLRLDYSEEHIKAYWRLFCIPCSPSSDTADFLSLACASPDCPFMVHSSPDMAAYCCKACFRRGKHGPDCEQRLKCPEAPRAFRWWRSVPGTEVHEWQEELFGPAKHEWKLAGCSTMQCASPGCCFSIGLDPCSDVHCCRGCASGGPRSHSQDCLQMPAALCAQRAKPQWRQQGGAQAPAPLAAPPALRRSPQEEERIVKCKRAVQDLGLCLDFEVVDKDGVRVWHQPWAAGKPCQVMRCGSRLSGSVGETWICTGARADGSVEAREAWVSLDEKLGAVCLELSALRVYAEAVELHWQALPIPSEGVSYTVHFRGVRPPLQHLKDTQAFFTALPAGELWGFRVEARVRRTANLVRVWGPWTSVQGRRLESSPAEAAHAFLDPDGVARGGCSWSSCSAWAQPREGELHTCARCGHPSSKHKHLAEVCYSPPSALLLPQPQVFQVEWDHADVFDWPSEHGKKCGSFHRGDKVAGLLFGPWLRLDHSTRRRWLRRLEERLELGVKALAEFAPCVTHSLPVTGSLWVRYAQHRKAAPMGDAARSKGSPHDRGKEFLPSLVLVCGSCINCAAAVAMTLASHSAVVSLRPGTLHLVQSLLTLLGEEGVPLQILRRQTLELVHRWLDSEAGGDSDGRVRVLQLCLNLIDELTLSRPAEVAFATFCRGLFRIAAGKCSGRGSIVFGEVPACRRLLATLSQALPGLKVIHCVRDGRDVAISLREQIGGSLGGAAERWADSAEEVAAWGLDHPSQYLWLRYEELHQPFSQEPARLQRFLGLSAEALSVSCPTQLPSDTWKDTPRQEQLVFTSGKVFAALRHFHYPQKPYPVSLEEKDTSQHLLRAVRRRMCAESCELPPLTEPSKGEVLVIRTAKFSGERLSQDKPLQLRPGRLDPKIATLVLDPTERYQTLVGFGGSFTEAAAEVFKALSPVRRELLIRSYFRRDVGLGYHLGRLPMTSSDFSPQSHCHWTCCDQGLEAFSIQQYRPAILPMLQCAQQALRDAGDGEGSLQLVASPWSPPSWMKTNRNMVEGSLLPECRGAWAEYFARFARAFAEEDLPLWAVTVQNEPNNRNGRWETCHYSPEEERDFIRDHLGPALREAPGLESDQGPRLLFWDHNRAGMGNRPEIVYGDKLAASYIWGLAAHWYDTWDSDRNQFENLDYVHQLRPEKHLVMTEASIEQPPSSAMGDWAGGEKYAFHIINDLNNWCEAWIDWNLLLDERGGPNHAENFCMAPVHANTDVDALLFQPSFYYIGHFSRYLTPGSVGIRASIEGATAQQMSVLSATAFQQSNGTVAAVVLNEGEVPVGFELALRRGRNYYLKTWAVALERSITTYLLREPEKV